jgi:hypothetical protein
MDLCGLPWDFCIPIPINLKVHTAHEIKHNFTVTNLDLYAGGWVTKSVTLYVTTVLKGNDLHGPD